MSDFFSSMSDDFIFTFLFSFIAVIIWAVFIFYFCNKKKWSKSTEKIRKTPIMGSIVVGIFVISTNVLSYCKFEYIPTIPGHKSIPYITIILTIMCIVGIVINKYLKYLSKEDPYAKSLLISSFHLLLLGQCAAFFTYGKIYWSTIFVLLLFAVMLFLSWVYGIKRGRLWISIFLQVDILFVLILSFSFIFCENGIVEGNITYIGIKERKEQESKGQENKEKKEIKEQQADGLEPYLYFSAVTFTTLGYGDIRPTKNSRLWSASEALLGYIYLSLLLGLILLQLSDYHKKHNDKSESLSNDIKKIKELIEKLPKKIKELVKSD